MANTKKPTLFYDGIKLQPTASASPSSKGEIKYDSSTDKIKVMVNATTQSLVTEAGTATLTGKTIDGDDNTVQDLPITALKTVLADASKFLVRDASGIPTSDKAVPSGAVVGTTDTQTLTGKTIVAASNTITTASSGSLAATELNAALAELQTDIDTRATSTALSNHESDTSTHGVGVIVGTTESQALSNKTIDADQNTISNIENADIKAAAGIALNKLAATTASRAAVTDGSGFLTASSVTSTELGRLSGIGSAAVGTSDSNTLSNKTFSDAPILAEIATPSTPSSGYGKVYFKSDGFLYQLNDAGTETKVGAGSGGINYISANPDFESGTTGYTAYADAAATTPVDGTGGSPTVTITRTTSSPLRGTGSGLITKDAANRQGEGVSFDFTLSDADKAKPLSISFDYEIASGTYASGDLTLYIYDVTNSALIQPAGYSIANVGFESKHTATFQTSATGTSYRLIFHVASTSASAYTFKFDNVTVGPQNIQYGHASTEWTEYSPTMNASFSSGGGNSRFLWRRDGGDMLIKGSIGFGGSSPSLGTTPFSFDLPSGYSASSTLIEGADGTATVANQRVGDADYYDASNGDTANNVHYCYMVDANTIGVVSQIETGASELWGSTSSIPVAPATSDQAHFFNIRIPIEGWSNNVIMSSDTDTRVVAANYYGVADTSVDQNTTETVLYDTKQVDTHNAFNTLTGEYTVPVPGYYRVFASLSALDSSASAAARGLHIQYDSNTVATGGVHVVASTVSLRHIVSAIINAQAGKIIRVRYNQPSGAGTATLDDNISSYINIERLSGPSSIAATETVFARYRTNAGQSIPGSSTLTVVDFEDKSKDSHGAVTTGASWKFTAPVSGVYQVAASVVWDSATFTSGTRRELYLAKNGTSSSEIVATLGINQSQASTTDFIHTTGVTSIELLAGDYVTILAQQTEGASRSLNGTTYHNWVTVTRTGNYF